MRVNRLAPALLLGLLALLATLAAAPAPVAAYPQFRYSTGTDRCVACHYSPDGGGLLNDFGRSEMGDTVAGRGDGSLLHGAWTPPAWLTLGGDLRGAGLGKHVEGEPALWTGFPMQADLYARVARGPVSLHLTGGLNGAARRQPDGRTLSGLLVSREHFVMIENGDQTRYARVGRFFPVLGLRLADHTAYPRRYLDQYTLEEPYGLGVGGVRGRWEGHLSLFVANPLPRTGTANSSGGALYLERSLASGNGSVAGQARVAVGDDDRRVLAGAVASWWLPGPGLLVHGELDLQRQSFTGVGTPRWQVLTYVGVSRPFLPGYMIGAAVQRWAPDLTLRASTRNALELNLQAFPYAHVEVHLLTRVEATGGDTTTPGALGLLQLHYTL